MVGARYCRGGLGAAKSWNVVAGVACLAFFAPLFAVTYLVARAGGGPALIARPAIRRDGTSFGALRFNLHGRNRGAIGRFIRWSRLETMPLLINVVRGEVALAELFRAG